MDTGSIHYNDGVGDRKQWFGVSGELINVKEFGAKGDGVTDDTPAILAAIQAGQLHGGAEVVFPAGIFHIASNVSVPTNITLSFVATGQIDVSAGVTLTISGPVCAPPRQIFRGAGTVLFGSGLVPRVYPQWWGAYADGTHPKETTSAIRAAVRSLFTTAFQSAGLDFLGSSQVLEFLAGHYAIDDEIVVGPYANVITGSQAIIEQTANTQTHPKGIFNFSGAYTIRVSGLRFLGGTTQISLSNANIDTSLFQIDHCEFQLATSYAIAASPAHPADHLSALLTIDQCKFFTPKQVLMNYCDVAVVSNSLVYVSQPPSDPNTAVFSNMHGVLHLHHMVGVPSFPVSSGCRWIDNYGSVFVEASRFGGEAAGVAIVYNYAGPDSGFPFLGPSIVIKNSWVYAGVTGDGAVLNLKTAVPQVFIFEGNTGPADNALIVNGGAIDLDTYLRSFPTNNFRFVMEPNQQNLIGSIPDPLKPLFNFLEDERLAPTAPTTGLWKAGRICLAHPPQADPCRGVWRAPLRPAPHL
jgi:hypothetical protein